MMEKKVLLIIICMVLLSSFVYSEIFTTAEQQKVTTGESTNYYYTQIKTIKSNSYIGLDKNDAGYIKTLQDGQGFGRVYFIPAYKVADTWFLCPIYGSISYDSVSQIKNGWYADIGSNEYTCYEYMGDGNIEPITQKVNMDTQFSFQTNKNNGKTKINVNTTLIDNYNVQDTGFAFYIESEADNKFKKIGYKRDDGSYSRFDSLAFETGKIENSEITKKIEFLTSDNEVTGHSFDWSDMLDTGNYFAGIYQLRGTNYGLMVGTYGYGASKDINIDPLYVVDYSPNPAEYLYNGTVTISGDNQFTNVSNITEDMTDNNTATAYPIERPNKIRRQIYYEDFEDDNNGDFVCNEISGSIDCTNTGGSPTLDGDHSAGLDGTGSDAEGALELYLDLSELSNINLSYIRYRTGSESGEGWWVEVTNDSGSTWDTLESGDADEPQSTENWALSDSYASAGFGLRFRCEADHSSDEFAFDNVDITAQNNTYVEKAMNGKFSETYNDTFNYFIRFNKVSGVTNENVTIYPYINDTHINNSLNVTKNTNVLGEIFVNVSSLMDYMTNDISLGYSGFRLTSLNTINISELYLQKELNDTEPPQINGCTVSSNTVGCLDYVEYCCNITDNFGLDNDEIIYTIGGQNYTATKRYDKFGVNLTFSANETASYDLEQVYAEDILGQSSIVQPNLSVNYSCVYEDYIGIEHTPDTLNDQINLTNVSVTLFWTTNNLSDSKVEYGLQPDNLSNLLHNSQLEVNHYVDIVGLDPNTTYYYNLTSERNPVQEVGVYNFTTSTNCEFEARYGECLINNSQLKYYEEVNNCTYNGTPPPDNGTYVYCNYCSENLVKQSISDCYFYNNTYIQDFMWVDTNYSTCCAVTGLTSDCSVDYSPYNETFNNSCTEIQQDFEIGISENIYYGLHPEGKVKAKITMNDTSNNTYKCISYIKRFNGSVGDMIQTNPNYEKKTKALVDLGFQNYEDRQYFNIKHGIGNVYFTDKNVIVDGRPYVYGVECSDGERILVAEKIIDAHYKKVNEPVTRWFWGVENFELLFIGFIGIFLIVVIGGIIWKFGSSTGR